jgi:23S rRNA (cytosine1962-C5)-methyltransferase
VSNSGSDDHTSRLPLARLNPREDRRLLRGHLWAYRNEFGAIPDAVDGALVKVVSDGGRAIGTGFFQSEGGIAVRFVASGREEFDESALARRIAAAGAMREKLFPGENVYRWVHGEGDGLPGLIADRYGPKVVVHAESPFYRTRADALAASFRAADGVTGVVMRLAGEWVESGEIVTPVTCEISGIRFSVDPKHGQKTGLFLDQRRNWTLLEPFCGGARVLDGHCYVGAWSLHAARYGAREVLGVDTSHAAIEQAAANARTNRAGDTCAFLCADIHDVLASAEPYDAIVLDPPALAKSRNHLHKALGLYQALNRDAMKALAPGGVLITSSCSQPVDEATFLETLKRAATAAGRRFQVLEIRGAAPDHPALLAMPETRYLTCIVLRLV